MDGTNPQSNGNVNPTGSGREIPIASQRGSYLSLRCEPRGDSTTTWIVSRVANAGIVNRFTSTIVASNGLSRRKLLRQLSVNIGTITRSVRGCENLPELALAITSDFQEFFRQADGFLFRAGFEDGEAADDFL